MEAARPRLPLSPARHKARRRAENRAWLFRSLTGLHSVRTLRDSFRVVVRSGAVSCPIPPGPERQVVRAALHTHTTYSDGIGTVPEVVRAARAAGVRVVVLADHDTLQPLADGWEGFHGEELVLAGTELRTPSGYLLALGLPREFTAQGEAGEIVSGVNRAGGLAFAALSAHPTSPWREWSIPGLAGLEILNLHSLSRQAASVFALPRFSGLLAAGRRMDALSMLTIRPHRELRIWDRMLLDRPCVGLASADAHGHIRIAGRSVRLPTYSESFGLVQTHLIMREPLSLDVGRARAQVLDALRVGRCRLVYPHAADPSGLRFFYADARGAVTEGEHGDWRSGGRLYVRSPRRNALFRVYANGELLGQASGAEAAFECPAPGTYRLEVELYSRRVGPLCSGVRPWLYTNPIYLA